MLLSLLRIVGRSEVLIKRKRFRKRALNLVELRQLILYVGEYLRVAFLGKDEKTKSLVEELNRHIANEQRMVLAITYEQTNRIAALASTTLNYTTHIEDNLKEAQSRQVDKEATEQMEKALRTIATEDTDDWYSFNKKNLLSGRVLGCRKSPSSIFGYINKHQSCGFLEALGLAKPCLVHG